MGEYAAINWKFIKIIMGLLFEIFGFTDVQLLVITEHIYTSYGFCSFIVSHHYSAQELLIICRILAGAQRNANIPLKYPPHIHHSLGNRLHSNRQQCSDEPMKDFWPDMRYIGHNQAALIRIGGSIALTHAGIHNCPFAAAGECNNSAFVECRVRNAECRMQN